MGRTSFLHMGIAVLLVLVGCTQTSTPAADGIVFDETRSLGSAGGDIASDTYGVRVSFEADTLQAETSVTLRVFDKQFSAIGRDGYQHSPNGVELTLDPHVLKPDALLTLELTHAGTYDAFGTMLAVEREDGVLVPLDSEPSEPGSVKGVLAESMLERLSVPTPAGERLTLRVFTANRLEGLETTAGPLVTSVRPFQDGAFSGEVANLSGKRVAVVVHGIESSLADLTSLGQFLDDFQQSGTNSEYYDAVIGFEYSSNAPLAEIGTALTEGMSSVGLANAQSVDLFAHSMGNLVSRYAIETVSLPNRVANVEHYVSLGGPHAGIPFGDLTHLEQAFFYLFNLSSTPCLKDLITNGENGEPQTAFLKNLNLPEGQQGPNLTTTEYFTLSGNDYSGESPPLGDTVHLLYLAAVGIDEGEQDDGLVADYSAQNDLLSRQSQTWTANTPLDLTHSELHTASEAYTTMTTWINGWR